MATNLALAPRSYRSSLAALMSHRDGVLYTTDHVFEADHLASVTADDVARFSTFELLERPRQPWLTSQRSADPTLWNTGRSPSPFSCL